MSPSAHTRFHELLTEELEAMGACAVGFAPPKAAAGFRVPSEYQKAEGLRYLRETERTRRDAERLWPGVQSIAIAAFPYPVAMPRRPEGLVGRVASYALGTDYHRVLPSLMAGAIERAASRSGLAWNPHWTASDSKPLAERTLAAAAGLGVVGRSRLLIVPGLGPNVLLAEAGLPTPSRHDSTQEPSAWDPCGTCDRCVAACPTGALSETGFRPDLCISYWTTQDKGLVPPELALKFQGWFFGCDACISACPHTQRDVPTPWQSPRGAQNTASRMGGPQEGETEGLQGPWVELEPLLGLSGRKLRRRFAGTALSILSPARILRNALVAAVSGASPQRGATLVAQARKHPHPLVSEQATLLYNALH